MTKKDIEIRECTTPNELSGCVRLQREVFNLPEIEISPVRHFIVTRHAGGFTLGAFFEGKMVGFVLSVLAYRGNDRMYYSHMTAVDKDFQNYGIGTRLKWTQREYALTKGVKFLKWTFQPVLARNAYFNLEKLGAIMQEYEPNFYGTDYAATGEKEKVGVESDRLFAEWELESDKVNTLAQKGEFTEQGELVKSIETINDWKQLLNTDRQKAVLEQMRIRKEFQSAFKDGQVCRSFKSDIQNPKFLLYKD